MDLSSHSPKGTLAPISLSRSLPSRSHLAPISLLISRSHYSHRIIISGSLPHTNASTHLHIYTPTPCVELCHTSYHHTSIEYNHEQPSPSTLHPPLHHHSNCQRRK